MKKIILFTIMLFSLFGYSQKDFKWEKIDSIQKSKVELYSDTKMFIAEYWKSAKDVIQNDDKESGMILIKGIVNEDIYFQFNNHTYTYGYNVKFLFRDKKYKIIIDNVYCERAMCGVNEWPLVEPTEDTSESSGYVPAKKLTDLMANLKTDLQKIIDFYESKIKLINSNNEKW
jgi:hypothetical protein